MEKTLAAINQMRELGIISNYAIGGGMAAMFYMEPALTYDLDILAPIYKWAARAGHKTFKEHLLIGGLPVQFIGGVP